MAAPSCSLPSSSGVLREPPSFLCPTARVLTGSAGLRLPSTLKTLDEGNFRTREALGNVASKVNKVSTGSSGRELPPEISISNVNGSVIPAPGSAPPASRGDRRDSAKGVGPGPWAWGRRSVKVVLGQTSQGGEETGGSLKGIRSCCSLT